MKKHRNSVVPKVRERSWSTLKNEMFTKALPVPRGARREAVPQVEPLLRVARTFDSNARDDCLYPNRFPVARSEA